MKCPKCGGEIPFYDLKPNCRHCGVNIMYYTQEAGLIRDAKRTELEGAVARMVIARVKAAFIGGKLQIFRMVAVLLAVAALLLPLASTAYTLPFFDGKLSLGILGLVQGFQNGLFMKVPQLLSSAVVAAQTTPAVVAAGFMVAIVLIDVMILLALLLGFLNLTKSTKFMRNASVAGAAVAVAGQIAVLVLSKTTPVSSAAAFSMGFGCLAVCAMFLVEFFLNRALLKKGIEPTYRENDLKRKELLKKVRAGEVDLDDLTLPIFESEEEREERMKALEEALKAEEEGKEL